MSFLVLLMLLIAVAGYWIVTQVLPERRHISVIRDGLAESYLDTINAQRHEQGLVMLELDEELQEVAVQKATHQFMTGMDDEGWEYPKHYDAMFGKSLLMEALLQGAWDKMPEKLAKQKELVDGEWIRVGIGVAGGQSGQVVVAMVLCREAWEMMPQVAAHRNLMERLILGD